jgi:putative ABC transport system permease protein
LVLVGATVAINGFLSTRPFAPMLQLLGGILLLIGLTALVGRFLKSRVTATLGGAATVAFGLYAYVYLPDFDREIDVGFSVATTSAIVITVAAVILIAANLTIFEGLAGLFGPRTRAVIRTATAYPVGYRFRTAMSMAMFALVLYMVAAFAVWGGLGGGDFEQQSGGFQVLARSAFPAGNLSTEGSAEVVGMFSTQYTGGYKVANSMEVTFPVLLFGIDSKMASANRFEFTEKAEGLTDAQIWEQLGSRNDVVVLDLATNPGSAEIGESLEIRTDKGPRQFKVIGFLNESFLQGLFISKGAFSELYPNRSVDSAWLVRAKPDVSPAELSGQIEAAYPGVDARSTREIFDADAEGQRTFVGIFQVLLKLGVVIGISGLAIGSIRTILERRQSVGIMRALGFRRPMVGASLLIEALLIATLGCAIGVATGLVGTYFLIDEQVPNLRFSADWPQITGTLLIVYAATLAFTALPAWRAASLNPAEAVRYVE